MLKFLYLASLLVSIVLANLTINTPNSNWQAGSETTITWSYTQDGSSGGLNFDLVTGPDDNLKPVASLASNVDPKAGSLTIRVPTGLDPSATYAIRGTMSNLLRFTARFSVLGGERVPLVTTSSAPSKTSSDPTSTPLKPAETQSLTPTNEPATQDDSSDAAGLATTSAVALMVPIWIGLLF